MKVNSHVTSWHSSAIRGTFHMKCFYYFRVLFSAHNVTVKAWKSKFWNFTEFSLVILSNAVWRYDSVIRSIFVLSSVNDHQGDSSLGRWQQIIYTGGYSETFDGFFLPTALQCITYELSETKTLHIGKLLEMRQMVKLKLFCTKVVQIRALGTTSEIQFNNERIQIT